MHSVRPSLSRSSSAIRSSMRALQLRDSRAQSRRLGRAVGRQLGQLDADLVERQTHALREHDESDPPQYLPLIAAMARARSLGGDHAALLVEAKRRSLHAAAARDLVDFHQLWHARSQAETALDFKFNLNL